MIPERLLKLGLLYGHPIYIYLDPREVSDTDIEYIRAKAENFLGKSFKIADMLDDLKQLILEA